MKKIFTLTLLLAAPISYAAEAELKKAAATGAGASAGAGTAPFSSLQTSHPAIARLGRMAFDGISAAPIPANPAITKDEILDTLSLVDHACIALATGTPQEQAFTQSLDKALHHGQTALPVFIRSDKKSVLLLMAAALANGTEDEQVFIKSVEEVVKHGEIALTTLAKMDKKELASHACAGLSAGTEDEQLLGTELQALLTHGEETFVNLLSTNREALFAKPEIRALKDKIIMLAMRAAMMGTATLSPAAVLAIQKPLLAEIESLKKQIEDLKNERDADRAERMLLLKTAMISMRHGAKPVSATEPFLIEYRQHKEEGKKG